MRKRRYAHPNMEHCVPDILTEDIHRFLGKRQRLDADASDQPQAVVHNLVSTAQIRSSLMPFDLFRIAKIIPNMQYDKQKFAAITIRLFDPFCTVLLFTSGKMVLTGCKTFIECVTATYKVLTTLQVGFPRQKIKLFDISIQNIVGNVDVVLAPDQHIDLDRMMQENSVFCTYLKNMFPGLIYRPLDCPVVLLVFKSGKIVITGGKSSNDIFVGWRSLWPFVRQYIAPAPT